MKQQHIEFLDLTYEQQCSWSCKVFAIDLPGAMQDALRTLGQPADTLVTLSGDVSVDGDPGDQSNAILDADIECLLTHGDTTITVDWDDLPTALTASLAYALYRDFDWADWSTGGYYED